MSKPTRDGEWIESDQSNRTWLVAFIGSGWIWLIVTILVSGALLFFNAIFCVSLYFGLITQSSESSPSLHRWLSLPAISQLAMFLGPLLLLVFQWFLIDSLRDFLTQRRQRIDH